MINNIKWVFGIYSKEDLDVMQSWDLQRKIQVTTTRIIEWYEYFGGNVYVAFSGGKDSTVLLDIVRRIYPDVPAVFCDTGLEFPEIREFVKQHDKETHPKLWEYCMKPWSEHGLGMRTVLEFIGIPCE